MIITIETAVSTATNPIIAGSRKTLLEGDIIVGETTSGTLSPASPETTATGLTEDATGFAAGVAAGSPVEVGCVLADDDAVATGCGATAADGDGVTAGFGRDFGFAVAEPTGTSPPAVGIISTYCDTDDAGPSPARAAVGSSTATTATARAIPDLRA